METDLLARICAELEQRMAELRPLLDEYERLLAADSALDSFEAEPADGLPTPKPAPRSTAPRRRTRGPRGSAAGTIELASSTPALPTPAPEPTPPAPSALPGPAPAPAEALPTHEPVVEELEPEPERKPAAPSDVRHAIVAALEHGSHTTSELVMVTAMSTPEIRTNLSQLARQRKVTRVKRPGDGKSAYALPASSTQT